MDTESLQTCQIRARPVFAHSHVFGVQAQVHDETRRGGVKFFLFRKIPRDVNWFQTLGSATLTAFIVQASTGVILAMYYQPSAAIDPNTGAPIAY